MWPYNYCEWKAITYGINKKKKSKSTTKSKWKKNKTLILMCTVPTITLFWMMSFLF
jgi:hypothetical protein